MLSLFAGAALLAAHVPSSITPAAVSRMIDRYGAKRTVNLLSRSAPNDPDTEFGHLDRVFDGIASGDERWLALVPRLAPGTDAGTAESLPIVLANALLKNPAGVLRLIKREASLLDAWGYPMIEPVPQWRFD